MKRNSLISNRCVIGGLLLLPVSVAAGTYTLLEPHAFSREAGRPVTETVRFTAVDTASSYTLNVSNGSGDAEPVSAATITLNGRPIFGPSDFNPNVAVLSEEVSLEAGNVLEVQLRGRPGSGVTVEILGEEFEPPSITAEVAPPANSDGWHNRDVTVTFTCTDTISGVADCPEPVVIENEGAEQVVTGTAIDNAGNTAETSVSIHLDKTAPSVTAQPGTPANAAGWHNTDVDVQFFCDDALSGIGFCSDPITVIMEGAGQTVTGSGTDRAGNSAEDALVLNIDKTAPGISASVNPAANNHGWHRSDVTVTFTCSDGLSGVAACPEPITLATEGADQTVSGTVLDNAGNTAAAGVSLSLDKTPPAIDILSPANDSVIAGDTPVIEIHYSDNLAVDTSSLVLRLNEAPVDAACQITGTGAECVLNELLSDGSLTLTAVITDLAGHEAVATSTFTIRDPDEPAEPVVQTTLRSYNDQGLLAAVDGPRTDIDDITTYEYDEQGNRIRIINALGHVTEITAHDAHGRPLAMVDPNGIATEMAYDARGRLLSRTVAAGTADAATTTFDYDKAGNLIKTTLPDGRFILNEYDAAHRIVAVEDNLGNRIEYTLDAQGNRIREDVRDPQGTLTRTLSRTYNDLNRLIETVGGAGQTTTFGYDANGNRTATTLDPAGLNQATVQAFDALNRLTATTDAANGITTYTYDARDNLTSVTDPTGLTTTYEYDGLDRVIRQDSPDTGITTYSYDEAGNRLSQTDARGVTRHYTYDALNRVTEMDYEDDSEDVTFIYDDCPNGIGRLCTMIDAAGTTDYAYDARGNRITKTTLRDGHTQSIGYAYNDADQLIQITYPSGRTVDYIRDALGQIERVTTTMNGSTGTLASHIGYEPFGPLGALNYGNGLIRENEYDLAYRVTAMLDTGGSAVLDRSYDYDPADNITGITDHRDATRSQTFFYDALNRLTDATGVYGALSYTYDANGNRLSRSENSTLETYSYAPDAHHLLQRDDGSNTLNYSYDPAGNTIDNTDHQFLYGEHNRLAEARIGGYPVASYRYNGRGERVKKEGGTLTYYHYNESGQLIAETDSTGDTLREYVYLNGRPLALIANGNIYTIHTDHLGTPQAMTDENQQIVWQADYEPFGRANITKEAVTNNLRFPGQYYDEETGLHYNYFRDYDPSIGRYIESDPISLKGGMNLYSYVNNNPPSNFDPQGLVKWDGVSYNIGLSFKIGFSYTQMELWSDCKCGIKYRVRVHVPQATGGFGGRVSATIQEVSIEDESQCPNPSVLLGSAITASAGATAGAFPIKGRPDISKPGIGKPGIGIRAEVSKIGSIESMGNISKPTYGVERSIHGGVGVPIIDILEMRKCCE